MSKNGITAVHVAEWLGVSQPTLTVLVRWLKEPLVKEKSHRQPERVPVDGDILRTADAARMLGMSAVALEGRRKRGVSPPFLVMGKKSIRWRRSDIEAWVESKSS